MVMPYREFRRGAIALMCLMLSLSASDLLAAGDDELRIFGYSQNMFRQVDDNVFANNSFLLQQLNIFLQKPLGPRWTSFINLEMVNSYSSFRRWGAFNLEEAWVRYRLRREFNLKLGLQIPIFNNFNEIKNRTPLLPYIIRPLVYESSFNEIILLDEFTPSRAFVQVYGVVPKGEFKIDYAVYLGNSPNINDNAGGDAFADGDSNQTGIDTTTTLLVGGRLGLRHHDIKFGVSATHDFTNLFQTGADVLGQTPAELEEVRRIRLGTDLSAHVGDYHLESEYIRVRYDDDIPDFLVRLEFYYATLGYQWTEQLHTFVSYWIEEEKLSPLGEFRIKVRNIGMRYDVTDGIALKAGYARGNQRNEGVSGETTRGHFDFYTGRYLGGVLMGCTRKISLALVVCGCVFVPAADAQILVIAHHAVLLDTLTKDQLIDYYTGDIGRWPDKSVVVVDLEHKGAARKVFYDFIGKRPSRLKSIWMKRMLSGEGDPPEAMKSEAEVVARVASTPGALGFISKANATEQVKTLLVIPETE